VNAREDMRRGAVTLARLAAVIKTDMADGREEDAKRLIFGFADDFRGSGLVGKAALIATEPPMTGDPRFDAVLAGTAEYFAREAGIPAPTWTEAPGRFVEPFWVWAPQVEFDAYVIARTPAPFFRHGVFIAREVFHRV
jgi:hypothetical protein